eukprot:3796757-Pyramimonas_sp.AAC.1
MSTRAALRRPAAAAEPPDVDADDAVRKRPAARGGPVPKAIEVAATAVKKKPAAAKSTAKPSKLPAPPM